MNSVMYLLNTTGDRFMQTMTVISQQIAQKGNKIQKNRARVHRIVVVKLRIYTIL